MKNCNTLMMVMFTLLFGCNDASKQSNTTSLLEKNKDEKEQKYGKDEFRRFTYFLNSNNPRTEQLLKRIDWGTMDGKAMDYGIYRANCYKKDSGYFFIFDAKPTLNSEELLNGFQQIDSVKYVMESMQTLGVKFPAADNALERIYKLDQKVIYAPFMGQLKRDVGAHKRFVWTLLLQEDPKLMAEYKKAHSMGQAWPQITENMKAMGVKDMEIYLSGTQAMLIMDTEPKFDMAVAGPKWQKLPREKEWQENVAKFQRIKPGSSIQEKWQDMHAL